MCFCWKVCLESMHLFLGSVKKSRVMSHYRIPTPNNAPFFRQNQAKLPDVERVMKMTPECGNVEITSNEIVFQSQSTEGKIRRLEPIPLHNYKLVANGSESLNRWD